MGVGQVPSRTTNGRSATFNGERSFGVTPRSGAILRSVRARAHPHLIRVEASSRRCLASGQALCDAAVDDAAVDADAFSDTVVDAVFDAVACGVIGEVPAAELNSA